MPEIKSKVKSQRSKVISNRNIKDNYFEIIVEAPEISPAAQPGQFVNIRVSDGLEPLLRRPLSVHKIIGSKMFLLYEVLGKGTRALSQKRSGECLDILGPLGNGFNLGSGSEARGPRPILVAGGMGTAPLVFLAEKLMEGKRQKAKGKIQVLIGAKAKNHILCEDEFRELGCQVKIATDDGSRGFKGYVSDLLESILRTANHACLSARQEPSITIYACGPAPMLREISRVSIEHNIPAQLSLESHMACGIGACMGCVIKVTKSPSHQVTGDFEYKRVCKEGPVFEAREIAWE